MALHGVPRPYYCAVHHNLLESRSAGALWPRPRLKAPPHCPAANTMSQLPLWFARSRRAGRSARPLPQTPARRTLVAALAVATCAVAAPSANAKSVSSQSAAGFRDSVGIQMHHSFSGFASDQTSTDTLSRMLTKLGIWHIRDSVCLDTEIACVRYRGRMLELRKQAARFDLPALDFLLGITREVESHPERDVRDADIERALVALTKPPLADLVVAIEQVNEPDLQKTGNWPQVTLADYATIKAKLAEPRFASLRNLPLLSPPMGHSEATGKLLSAGWNPNEPLVPNFHPYPPAWGGPENGLRNPCLPKTTVLQCVKRLVNTKTAPWATESGYSTTGQSASMTWVSRQAQATYMPRILLDNYSQGVARTYIYELNDLNPDISSSTAGYGLYESKYLDPWSVAASRAKLAAYAIARLNARIGEAGERIGTGRHGLEFDLLDKHGKVIPETEIRTVLLRRNDGTFALNLWQPKVVWSNAQFKQRTIAVPDLEVTVKFKTGVPGGWNATQFRPSLDDGATKFAGTMKFTANVGADVSLIDLRPSKYKGAIPGGPVELD